jgi:hypothetical protein
MHLTLRSSFGTFVWRAALVASAALFSVTLSCIVPLVAIALLAARTMPRRAAAVVVGLAFASEQVVGFTWLHYPHAASAYVWIPVLGAAAYAALAVSWLVRRPVYAFALAFAAYEAVVLAASIATGTAATFAMPIVARIAEANVVGLLALGVIYLAIVALDDRLGLRAGVRAAR